MGNLRTLGSISSWEFLKNSLKKHDPYVIPTFFERPSMLQGPYVEKLPSNSLALNPKIPKP